MANWPADRRLYLTADGSRVVEAGDPDADRLFVNTGQHVTERDVKRFGIQPIPTSSRARRRRRRTVDPVETSTRTLSPTDPDANAGDSVEDADDWRTKTNAELFEMAAGLGLSPPMRANKNELVAAISEALEGRGDGDGSGVDPQKQRGPSEDKSLGPSETKTAG